MKIKTIAANRKDVVNAISEILSTKAVYLGPPTFSYQIGETVVDREGTVETMNEEMKRELIDRGFCEDDSDRVEIKIPIELHTGASLKNLIFLIHSKQSLINKAIGRTVFEIKEEIIIALEQAKLESVNDFLTLIVPHPETVSGLTFTNEIITFDGFPMDIDRIMVFTDFVARLSQTAIQQKRVNPKETKEANEKYYMRVWLLRLGFGGPEGKEVRKVFLKNLSGHTAFRTDEEKDRAKERNKTRRGVREE